ncbi:hypothetical protein Tsubulata_027126 [Turnera subulata]|uniref:Uncharacterized protein n=1 Tax=Turnera subulata TaxID=218843 RepID=A0A9Q0GKH2_9ROSI|nr:hypothetical protein Tsubulata_027126 [Turnera subulata]
MDLSIVNGWYFVMLKDMFLNYSLDETLEDNLKGLLMIVFLEGDGYILMQLGSNFGFNPSLYTFLQY